MNNRKLGKLPPRHDARTLRLSNYISQPLAQPPEAVDWGKAVSDWGMMRNDELGCCTCAAAGHTIQTWTGNVGLLAGPSDADIVAAYSAVSGYDPSTGDNDNGAVMLDVLRLWRKTGIGSHMIGAFAVIDDDLTLRVKQTIANFESVYAGLSLPVSAQSQEIWNVVPGPTGSSGSWGGHAVNIVAYDSDGLTCITWGGLQRMTWAFWMAYADEAFAAISTDMLNGVGKTPLGFDMARLRQDLTAVTK
jgi:hypothetical protein